MKRIKRKKGTVVLPENRPYKTFREPVWYGTTERGHQRFMGSDEAYKWSLQTGKNVKMRLKKFELDEL